MTEPKSICLLRLSAIGDVCHAVATVQALQAKWPRLKITWIIGKVEYQLVKELPGVEFIVFDKKAGISAYFALKSALSNQQFDVLLHMQVALRASLATLFIRAKHKWGFDQRRAKEGQWLFTNQKVAPQDSPHVAEGFLAFAQALGVNKDYQLSWQMPMTAADEQWWLQQRQTLNLDHDYMVIVPAASKAERNWLAERYAQVADKMIEKNLKVVICGAPTSTELHLAEQIMQLSNNPLNNTLINLVGKTSLKQLLVVLKQAHFVLAPDTGPAHMAVTVDTPVVGLYAHSNPKRTGPYKYLHYVVSVYEKILLQQTGKRSGQLPWGTRVKGQLLMAEISVANVMEKIEQLLSDKLKNNNK
ncbi:glycosyltransferase family 9 protein [Aliikangiella maris]|uniref:Glycosyltransferase family 9 protein n=2 Tax=Aliikangiella maris TaxID=3162458 RepID=A0ABV2BS87_9GAMM